MKRRLALVLGVLALVGCLQPRVSSVTFGGLSDLDAVTATNPRVVAGSAYTFSTLLLGKPIRWNPCAAIHWRLRTAGAPAGGAAAVTSAVNRIGQATGTHWVYDGPSTSTPTTAALPKTISARPPVLIGWTDAAHSDLLRGQPSSVLGVTRTAWFGRTSASGTVAAIRGAVIALDRTDRLPATGALSWRSVTLHELGHAMGLNHAGSSRQMMYSVLGRSLTDLQSGDLTGLHALGRSQGCISL